MGTEHVEITGGRGKAAGLGGSHREHSNWRGDLAQKYKELLRKTQAEHWERSRANCLKLDSKVVWHTYCSKL
jgi:hypothetical protein